MSEALPVDKPNPDPAKPADPAKPTPAATANDEPPWAKALGKRLDDIETGVKTATSSVTELKSERAEEKRANTIAAKAKEIAAKDPAYFDFAARQAAEKTGKDFDLSAFAAQWAKDNPGQINSKPASTTTPGTPTPDATKVADFKARHAAALKSGDIAASLRVKREAAIAGVTIA